MCSSLELAQTQPPNMLPSHKISLALSNNRMSEVKNDSFSGSEYHLRSSWSILPPEAMLASVVYAVVPCCIEA